MDKSKIYLDLSKCTEEEIKEIYKKIKNSDQNIHTPTKRDLINGIVTHCYWFLFFDGNAWNQNETPLSGKTEITYPEFIKLFEGGESKEVLQVENNGWIKIESEKDLPEQGGRYYITRFGNVETAVYLKNNRWLVNGNDYPKTTNLHCITHYQKIIKPLPPIY